MKEIYRTAHHSLRPYVRPKKQQRLKPQNGTKTQQTAKKPGDVPQCL